jgi:enoyl-CoA hydratase
MTTHVSYAVEADVGVLTFSHEQEGKPPALDHAVLDELDGCLAVAQATAPDLRALIVRSASPKYFVVGANVDALHSLDAESIVPWVMAGHRVFNRLEALPLPVIAHVRGYALGGGLELAMACDLIVATRAAQLGQPEVRLGFVPGWGGSHRLPRRVGLSRAKELFFTGRILTAEAAAAIGLVDFVGDDGAVDAHLAALLDAIRQGSAGAIARTKHLLAGSLGRDLEQAAQAETLASVACLADSETQQRVADFLARRARR